MSLDKIFDYLVKKYAPEAILLHGSRLRADAAETSDYDIVLVASNTEEIYPHEYEGIALDISAVSSDVNIIENGNKTPNWPLKVLYDATGIGKKICEETEQAYQKGPKPLSDQEWHNRTNYTKRLIHKIEARGHDVSIRHYYLADFYMRVIRYWFEKRNKWTVSPYRALPIIENEDPSFFIALQNLWTDSYLSAIHKINKALFEQ